LNLNFKQLPKIDLHLHLDGAIRVATIAELGDELGIKLPSYDPKELAKFVQVNRDCRCLADFLKRFEVFYPILPFAKTQERIAYELCEDCARDNVIYFEARFAPVLAASKKFAMEDAIVAALEGFRRGQHNFGVRCGTILCCYRSVSVQENVETVKLAHKYRAARGGVRARAQAGDSHHHPRRRRRQRRKHPRGGIHARRDAHRPRREPATRSRTAQDRARQRNGVRDLPDEQSANLHRAVGAGASVQKISRRENPRDAQHR
jgi:adenosine deaminase